MYQINPNSYRSVFVLPQAAADDLKLASGGYVKLLVYAFAHAGEDLSAEDAAAGTGLSPEDAADPKAASTMRMTGSLSSVTGPVPAPAALHRTGIVAEGVVSEAAKTKTSRISLNSAIGVAPTNAKSSTAPLKTIRLKRPTGLPATPAASQAQDNAASVTQKKTLKLHRPGGVQARPSLGIAKPADAAEAPAAPENAGEAAAPAEIKLAPAAPAPAYKPIPKGVTIMSLITTIAATIVVGAVAYFLFVQGVGPTLDPNKATDNDMQLFPSTEELLPYHPFR